jgi:hypothetical protein
MKLRRWGYLAALAAGIVIGTKAGIEYAKSVYVSKDRTFIEGETVKKES